MPKQSYKKRPDGRYSCTWKPPGSNKPKYFYGETIAEMLAARDEYKAKIAQGMKAASMGATVKQYSTRWVFAHKQGVKPQTFDSYVRYLNAFNEQYGSYPIADITPTDIIQFYNSMAGRSRSYIAKAKQTVCGMFRSAVADRIILYDPTLTAKPPKGTAGTHRAIEPWERALIHHLPADNRMRSGVMVMLYAGLRRGEALALDIDRDVDFESKTITVREAVSYVGNRPVLGDPKTEAGERTIPIPDILLEELHGKHGLLMKSAKGTLMTETAFSCAWGTLLNQLSCIQNGHQKRWYGRTKEHKDIISKGGKIPPYVDIEIRPHDLRHSYCTMLFDTGVDLKTAQKWMGHADQEMTLRIYTHLTAEREKHASKAFLEGVNNTYHCQTHCQNPNAIAEHVDL